MKRLNQLMQQQHSIKSSGARKKRVLALSAMLLFLLSGCSVGAYPVDNFQEMHYSPAFRRQEMPVMSAPRNSIGYKGTGGPAAEVTVTPAYDLMKQEDLALVTANPVVLNDLVREEGEQLFVRNCSVCHGIEGDLQGGAAPALLAAHFEAAGVNPPLNLTLNATKNRTDGDIFGILTLGQGSIPPPPDSNNPEAWSTLTSMPSFAKLLTTEQRWAIVYHLRKLQGS